MTILYFQVDTDEMIAEAQISDEKAIIHNPQALSSNYSRTSVER